MGSVAAAAEGRRQARMMKRFYRRRPARRDPAAMTHADELKNSGLKATLPRIKVLEVFQKTTQRHMSAEDVFQVAARRACRRRPGHRLPGADAVRAGRASSRATTSRPARRCSSSTRASTTTTWSASTAAGSRSSSMPRSSSGRRHRADARLRAAGPRAGALRRLHQEELRATGPVALGRRARRAGATPACSCALWWRSMNSV